MREEIDGTVYDTEGAEEIGQYVRGDLGDPNFVREALYRTPQGEFFLAGRGGKYSKYGSPLADGPRKGIIPVSEEDAKAWALWADCRPGAVAEHFDVTPV